LIIYSNLSRAELLQVTHSTRTMVKQTADEMLLLQDSTLATAQNVQISSELAEGMLETIMEAKEYFGPLKELFELLAMISCAVQAIFSKDTATLLAIAAFTVASVVSISCCFGLRYGYYLTVGYCRLAYCTLTFQRSADYLIVQTVAAVLVVRFVPFCIWSALALSNPWATASSLGTMAIIGLVTHPRLGHRLLCTARLRRTPQSALSARAKLPVTMRGKKITAQEVSFLRQHNRRQDLHRSRRAQTTPPRL
jgi:hypothetical protein